MSTRYFSIVLGREGREDAVLRCVMAMFKAQVFCVFTVEIIKEFWHFPFNLQPYVNKILAFLDL